MGTCIDPLTKFLAGLDYEVLRHPETDLDPGWLIGLHAGRRVLLGRLDPLIPSDAATPKIEREVPVPNVAGRRTSALIAAVGMPILSEVLDAMNALPGSREAFRGASKITFELRDVARDSIGDEDMAAYLADARLEEDSPILCDYLLGPGKLSITTSTLKARSCRVDLRDVHGAPRAIDVAEVAMRCGAAVEVRADVTPGSITLTAAKPVVFAVRSLEIELREGVLALARRVAPFSAVPAGLVKRSFEAFSPEQEVGAGLLELLTPRRGSRAAPHAHDDAGGEGPVAWDRVRTDGDYDHTENAEAPAARREIGMGFCCGDGADQAIPEADSLAPDSWLWLWCEIGEQIEHAIGGGAPIAAAVPDEADLDVAIFSNPDGFAIEHTTGALRLCGGSAKVLRPAGKPVLRDPSLADRRLFFRVKTPRSNAKHQLRVHLHHRGLLVQALDVHAWVGPKGSCPERVAQSMICDYALSHDLAAARLRSLGDHTLSIFMNDSPGAAHGFRFFGGGGEIASSAVVEATQLQSIVMKARRALRLVSWGSEAPYDSNVDGYRYEEKGPTADFKADLVRLAKCGFQVWDVLAKALAGEAEVEALRRVMRKPGVVQLGLKESSTQILPLAILYDHAIDTQLKSIEAFSICPAYLEKPDCFEGECPSRDDPRVVCPSGFWGFRHALGVPIGSAGAPDAAATIGAGNVRLVASAYAGSFPLRDAHLGRLATVVGSGGFEQKLSRKETVARMREGGFQLLYFYCHGGVDQDAPYVLVGRDDEDPNQIARDTLRLAEVEWNAPHALVFINGCHTTALEPEQAIDLVNGFVETAKASGVIGTEVTVFEPLAVAIGEAFFRSLLAGADVGTALRDARRAVLLGKRPNPLGLVYIPFVLATLRVAGL